MTVKDRIINKMVQNSSWEKGIIEKIISHQMETIPKALAVHKSVEITGFGKFLFNDNRALQYMKKFEMQEAYYREALANSADEKERHKNSLKLNTTLLNIKHLKPRINEKPISDDVRGLEEQPDS